MIETLKKEWLTDPKTNILAGIVVALALIPEAIAFSIIAGVDPMVGLYASFIIAVSISILGGRPAMISAATGAIALLVSIWKHYRCRFWQHHGHGVDWHIRLGEKRCCATGCSQRFHPGHSSSEIFDQAIEQLVIYANVIGSDITPPVF